MFFCNILGSGSCTECNDVWISSDGATSWSLSTLTASWSGRDSHSAVVLSSTIILMGGYNGKFFYDA